jgi:hypothetical protein
MLGKSGQAEGEGHRVGQVEREGQHGIMHKNTSRVRTGEWYLHPTRQGVHLCPALRTLLMP